MNTPPSNVAAIQVLLPTYNGARFLARQLDSLAAQTCKEFSLLTYDDGSHDESAAVVDRYAAMLSIVRIPNVSGNNIGARKSFELLLTASKAPCIMFCDQDDIWENNRVEKSAAALANATDADLPVPAAVFSDLSLIDEHDAMVPGTFLGSSGSNPAAFFDPYYLAFRNPAPGCSMTINRQLVTAALPFSTTTLMHDWWLLLTAALVGKIVFIDEPLIRYRLHQSNTLGLATDRPLHPVRSMASLLRNKKVQAVYNQILPGLLQADTVFKRHGRGFSRLHFWCAFVAGRYFFPALARHVPLFSRFSWKRDSTK